MKSRQVIYFILLSLLFFSCKRKGLDQEVLEAKKSVSEQIKWLLEPEQHEALGLSTSAVHFLQELYGNRSFAPIWHQDTNLTVTGKFLIELLDNKLAFGLPESRYALPTDSLHSAAISELNLTHSLALMREDLSKGLLQGDSMLRPLSYPEVSTFQSEIRFQEHFDSIREHMLLWGKQDTSYQKLAHGLFDFARNHPLQEEISEQIIEKEDSTLAHLACRKNLISKGFLAAEHDSITYLETLKKFQSAHGLKPDAVIGSRTRDALRESNLMKCQRAALALDQLRRSADTTSHRIVVNIPEYRLRYYCNDSLIRTHKVVVGTPDKPTPMLESKLHTIVVYPYWHVPYSISSEEILPAVRKRSDYFEKNHMILKKGDVQVDPHTVDWKKISSKSFPYKVIQQPGKHNSLGIIKFQFNNPYSVYIHDTPSKSKFRQHVRAFSHGCVRCSDPLELAREILKRDRNKFDSDSLDQWLPVKKQRKVFLRHRIPIYLIYRSVVSADSENGLIFLRDIYVKDEKMLKIIFAS
ncbi:MAG: hypothetical protein EP338_14110 [Bacteroidetes bacterium]|nr:MAG: hypothetical protein EP338_14110 [Bacteroidota bacterium]